MCHILRCFSLQKQREKSFFAAFRLAFTKSPTSLDKKLILWYNTLVPKRRLLSLPHEYALPRPDPRGGMQDPYFPYAGPRPDTDF